ncbi:MAG TPA: transcriptional regulator [Stellaceae bacterium]|nr:transcriptional regulator [Stellaceae bacterium]
MPIARYTAQQLQRRKGRTRPKVRAATTEAAVAGHARADRSSTTRAELRRWHQVLPVDVVAIRAKTGLSQERFARTFRISPHTRRNWEQGRRMPEGPALVLLQAIDRNPRVVMRLLEG